MADPLEAACSLVGRFQYHFGRVEQKIDQAVIKLLSLDEKAAPIVTGSIAFASKLNLVRTSAYQQTVNDKDKQFADDTCNGVFKINNVPRRCSLSRRQVRARRRKKDTTEWATINGIKASTRSSKEMTAKAHAAI